MDEDSWENIRLAFQNREERRVSERDSASEVVSISSSTPPPLSSSSQGDGCISSSSSSSSSSYHGVISPTKLANLTRALQSFEKKDCYFSFNSLAASTPSPKKRKKSSSISTSDLWFVMKPTFFNHSIVLDEIKKRTKKTYTYLGLGLNYDNCPDFMDYTHSCNSMYLFLFLFIYLLS
jgi:hypothetical protein